MATFYQCKGGNYSDSCRNDGVWGWFGWLVIVWVCMMLLDWMRYAVRGGERPRYTWRCFL